MTSRRRLFKSEKGQGLVEFALILPILLLIIVGMIQFGVGLSYWMDLNHTANQGARYAAVNLNSVCTGNATSPCTGGSQTFNAFLKNELTARALKTGGTMSIPGTGASVCYYYSDTDSISGPTASDPVTVKISTPYKFVPFLGIAEVTLVGKATMRLEQVPARLSTSGGSIVLPTSPSC